MLNLNGECFTWFCQPGAYSWRKDDTAAYLQVDAGLAIPSGPAQRYAPLADWTGLFLQFANTFPEEKSILAFVNRYGMLLSAQTNRQFVLQKRSTVRKRRRSLEVLAPHSETLAFWQQEIRALRNAVHIWRASREYPPVDLINFLPLMEISDIEFMNSLRDSKQLDLLKKAHGWLGQQINKCLENQVSIQFEPDSSGNLTLQIMPRNLLQAIWFQFGLAVSQNKEYRQCDFCKDWFELSPEVARTNRRFCSAACKHKAYRQRKDSARQMRSEGLDVAQIASELETTVDVVQGWLDTP